MKRSAIVSMLFVLATLLAVPQDASAWPEYAKSVKEGCTKCHKEKSFYLNDLGYEYAASGYKWPPRGGFYVVSPLSTSAMQVVGFLHYLAGFLWFGTILYVHMVLRPAYADKGLPKTEIRLGVGSMLVAGITGTVLTLAKIKGADVLWHTEWGNILVIKMAIYGILILSATFVVLYIGPRLRRGIDAPELPADGNFDPATLARFDGKDGRRALVAYKGKVYEVTGSKFWAGGWHFRQHRAGEDLTEALSKAPHGAEKPEEMKEVGNYLPAMKPKLTDIQKLFHVLAYTNLALVFVMLAVLSRWEWGR